jgi:hypothetical protein
MHATGQASYFVADLCKIQRVAHARFGVLPMAGVFAAALFLSLFTVSDHVSILGGRYIDEGIQVQRHQAVINGNAGNPWQYRVLAPLMLQPVIAKLQERGIDRAYALSFISFRVLQDMAIFLAAFIYYRKFGLPTTYALMGISLLGWGISYSDYDSDLQFNTYFDVLFFLLAGICVLGRTPAWILPITALAAFNRETSGLIPIAFLAGSVASTAATSSRRRLVVLSAVSFAIYVTIFVWLRYRYGQQDLVLAYGRQVGWDLLQYNMRRVVTWNRLVATFSLVPVVALLGRSAWPPPLTAMFWAVVPIWFVIHAFAGVLAETRLLLVPYALVLVPGALFALRASQPRSLAVQKPS